MTNGFDNLKKDFDKKIMLLSEKINSGLAKDSDKIIKEYANGKNNL